MFFYESYLLPRTALLGLIFTFSLCFEEQADIKFSTAEHLRDIWDFEIKRNVNMIGIHIMNILNIFKTA